MLSLLASLFATAHARPAAKALDQQQKQKKHIKYEFMGPPGAVALMTLLPATIFLLYFACNQHQCISLNPMSDAFLKGSSDDKQTGAEGQMQAQPLQQRSRRPQHCIWLRFAADHRLAFVCDVSNSVVMWSPFVGHTLRSFADTYLLSWQAVRVFVGWFALHVLLYFILPGQVVEGVPIDERGTRLKYPLNGLASLFVSVGVMVGLAYAGVIPATIAYDEFTQLAFTAIVFSTLLAVYLYASSVWSSRDGGRHLTSETQLAAHGDTGNRVYDFFIGRTLNPRIGSLDLKYMCELRPGLIGWLLINLSMAAKQYEKHGEITVSIILVIIFQAYYVYDALSSERAILTTMDITTDGFGWMLSFGDLAWVPFTYCTQARFLVDHPAALSPLSVLGIIGVKLLGFWIFRGSNGQKNDFRTNPLAPNVSHLLYLQTRSGSKLLVSGWWGITRHMNYLGDVLMGLSWCLPCGVQSIIPYFYFFYFTGLLVHRERRDEDKCKAKYGDDWKRYTNIVKWRIVPYIY